jgi:hypothetical protein
VEAANAKDDNRFADFVITKRHFVEAMGEGE